MLLLPTWMAPFLYFWFLIKGNMYFGPILENPIARLNSFSQSKGTLHAYKSYLGEKYIFQLSRTQFNFKAREKILYVAGIVISNDPTKLPNKKVQIPYYLIKIKVRMLGHSIMFYRRLSSSAMTLVATLNTR